MGVYLAHPSGAGALQINLVGNRRDPPIRRGLTERAGERPHNLGPMPKPKRYQQSQINCDFLRDLSQVVKTHFNKLSGKEKTACAALTQGESPSSFGIRPRQFSLVAFLATQTLLLDGYAKKLIARDPGKMSKRMKKRIQSFIDKVATMESQLIIAVSASAEATSSKERKAKLEELNTQLNKTFELLRNRAQLNKKTPAKPSTAALVKGCISRATKLTSSQDNKFHRFHDDISRLNKSIGSEAA